MRALYALAGLVGFAFLPLIGQASAAVPRSVVPTVCNIVGSKFSLCVNNGTSAVPTIGLDSTTSNVALPSLATVQPAGTSTAVQQLLLYGDHPSVRMFGAANASGQWNGDGVTDDSLAIRAAVAYYCTLPAGGRIELPAGSIAVATTVTITCPNVSLEGKGTGSPFHDVGAGGPTYSTQWTWIGADNGTMLLVNPSVTGTGLQHLSNNNITGILFEGNGSSVSGHGAGTGLDWRSANGSRVQVAYHNTLAYGVRVDTGGTNIGEFIDPQGNDFWIEGSNESTVGTGVYCGGTTIGGFNNGNCSLNIFHHVFLRIKNGDGFVFGYSDHNFIDYLNVQMVGGGGSGRTLVFQAGTQIGGSGNGYVAYNNLVRYVTGPSPIVAQGTDVAPYPSHDNSILRLDRSNNAPFVTAGTGATFKTWTDNGNLFSTNVFNGVNIDAPTRAWDVVGSVGVTTGYYLNGAAVVDAAGNGGFTTVTSGGPVSTGQKTVATLPSCGAPQKGQMLTVSDASAPTYGATLAGGGAVEAIALCNGTNWTAH